MGIVRVQRLVVPEGTAELRKARPQAPCGFALSLNQARAAFSLLEMLVVISIIGLLIAVMLPALAACRRAGRNLKCVSQMRQVAFDFRIFADDFAVRTRGDSERLGPRFFFIEDFQESIYRVDEFWDAPEAVRATYDSQRQVMMCPEAGEVLRKRANRPCSNGAVYPFASVSMGFNRRLHRAGPHMRTRVLSSKILEHPDVPLVMDVDGAAADLSGRVPYYIAPSLNIGDGYDDGSFWFPSYRHGGSLNVAFVGGHVVSVKNPLQANGWRWNYIP